MGTALLILLLLVLLLALGVALAVLAGKRGAAAWAQPLGAERAPCSLQRGILTPSPLPPAAAAAAAAQVPVTPATPLLVLGCPRGWVGYNGVCYYFSRDHSSWEQAEERCSELGASLAILKDEEEMVSEGLGRCGVAEGSLGVLLGRARCSWGRGCSPGPGPCREGAPAGGGSPGHGSPRGPGQLPLLSPGQGLLFRLRGNGDYWLGLRRRGERLHWGDGSSYSSR